MIITNKDKVVFLSKSEIEYLNNKHEIIYTSSGKMYYKDMEVLSTEKQKLSVKNNFLGGI